MCSAVCPLLLTKRAGWRSSGRLLCQTLTTAHWCGTFVERQTHQKVRNYKSGLYAVFLTILQVIMTICWKNGTNKADALPHYTYGTRSLQSNTWPQSPYMNDMFTSRQEQTHSLRNAHQLNIPCTRTVGFGSYSIQFEGARVWNHIPNKIRCAENLAFKKKTTSYMGRMSLCHLYQLFLVTPCFT